jgi:hypothetical protein
VLSPSSCLRGPILSHSSDLVFGFLAFDHFLGIFVCVLSFSLFFELVIACVVTALI